MSIPQATPGEAASEATATSEITFLIIERLVSSPIITRQSIRNPSPSPEKLPIYGSLRISSCAALPLQWLLTKTGDNRNNAFLRRYSSQEIAAQESPLLFLVDPRLRRSLRRLRPLFA